MKSFPKYEKYLIFSRNIFIFPKFYAVSLELLRNYILLWRISLSASHTFFFAQFVIMYIYRDCSKRTGARYIQEGKLMKRRTRLQRQVCHSKYIDTSILLIEILYLSKRKIIFNISCARITAGTLNDNKRLSTIEISWD